jgi:uncharacterized protein YacL
MSADFVSRIVGLFVFAILGGRIGANLSDVLNLSAEATAVIFGLVGVLVGLILTPWITLRPLRFLRISITEMPIDKLFMTLLGGILGLVIALLVAYPLSLLESPFRIWLPATVSLVAGYLGMTIFSLRAREILELANERFAKGRLPISSQAKRNLIVDTSVLIDGRIVDIVETGFLAGTFIIPQFVLTELHQVSDSADMLRRNRGRRGLTMLNKLRQNDFVPVKIVDDDFHDIDKVDNKLIALATQMSGVILTNDYNLSQVAEAQNIMSLNVNNLSNAVRSLYIPGETFATRIIQEGKDPKQGISYLDDGTMVVIENGKSYMDRSIDVTVTKLINRPTGRMIFAVPEHEYEQYQRNLNQYDDN